MTRAARLTLFALVVLVPFVAMAQATGSAASSALDVGAILSLVSWFSKVILGAAPALRNTVVGKILAFFVSGPFGPAVIAQSQPGP